MTKAVVEKMMTFPSAVKREPAIDAWLSAQRDDLRPFVETWFAHMRRCGADVRELMHDGCPPRASTRRRSATSMRSRAHVNVGFFFGALLKDPSRLLEGTGKRMRHVKLRPGEQLDVAALGVLIDLAYSDVRRRLGK